jgi:fermentation-respiration switch protein FrsA (DUF1100 family)
MDLPDLFLFENGTRVKTPDDWRLRRTEMLNRILDVEYGRLPPTPSRVSGEMLHCQTVARFAGARYVNYRIVTDGGALPFSFLLQLTIPAGEGPFPVVVSGDGCWRYASDEVTLEVLRRGYIFAQFNRTEIVPDIYETKRDTGLYRVYPEGDYGALAAWAWGCHRVVDFLITQRDVDASRIAVVGHSRGGKAVLLAGATDERIALTAPNNSGSGGAGCFRFTGEGSETLSDSLRQVPYWYSSRLKDFIGREGELPFDQHSLKALVAPRALLSTEALGDPWSNPRGTYQTYLAAREAYRFLNAEDRIGIWFREGKHEHGIADWKAFLNFADRTLCGKPIDESFTHNPFPDMQPAFSWMSPSISPHP